MELALSNGEEDVRGISGTGPRVRIPASVQDRNRNQSCTVRFLRSLGPRKDTFAARFARAINSPARFQNSGSTDATPWRLCTSLYNPNSRMGRVEARKWKRNSGGPKRPVAPAGIDDDSDFDNAKAARFFRRGLTKAGNAGATAFVISADPFFVDQRLNLVDAANSVGKPICYPFEIYGQLDNPPNNAFSRWLGPDLKAAYRRIGRQAGTVLTAIQGSTAQPFEFYEAPNANAQAQPFPTPMFDATNEE